MYLTDSYCHFLTFFIYFWAYLKGIFTDSGLFLGLLFKHSRYILEVFYTFKAIR